MVISKNIIIGKTIAHESEKILKAAAAGKPCSYIAWYGITTALEKENLLYILSGIEMRRQAYLNSSLTLLGLAGSKKEAGEIVLDLVREGYNKGNIHCMKQYLESIS